MNKYCFRRILKFQQFLCQERSDTFYYLGGPTRVMSANLVLFFFFGLAKVKYIINTLININNLNLNTLMTQTLTVAVYLWHSRVKCLDLLNKLRFHYHLPDLHRFIHIITTTISNNNLSVIKYLWQLIGKV